MGRRRRIFRSLVLVAGFALVPLTVATLYVYPSSLAVVAYELHPPGWPASLDGFRIAAVGDVHGGAPFIDESKLDEIASRISGERPDLIVWLGDYVIQGVAGGEFMPPETVARHLAAARATFGHVAIIGNHDRWLDPGRVAAAFESAGIPFLLSSSRVFDVSGERLHVHGLDDFESSRAYWPGLRHARREWADLPPDEPLVVLTHNPDVFPYLPPRVTLTLAAHTHGGQVRLPFLGTPVVPSSFGQRFASGAIIEDGRHLFVNTGIGTSIIPVRFRVTPEISILTLRSGGPGPNATLR